MVRSSDLKNNSIPDASERAAHDGQGEQPEQHIVVIVGRGEPSVVHPGPPDAKKRHGEPDDSVSGVPTGDGVVQPGCRGRNGDDGHEVEQQLKRGSDPVRLVHVPRLHGAESGGGGHGIPLVGAVVTGTTMTAVMRTGSGSHGTAWNRTMATIPTLKVHIRESSCRIRLWPLWVSTKSPCTDLGQVLEIVEARFAVPGVHKPIV
jgi:hypothetical protein